MTQNQSLNTLVLVITHNGIYRKITKLTLFLRMPIFTHEQLDVSGKIYLFGNFETHVSIFLSLCILCRI